MNNRQIILRKVNVNNLKDVDLTLNQKELIVFTGVSGSGKSSLAFDTIFVEGQRRYIESLSHSSKHHLIEFKKPDVAEVSGLSPTIAIEQKTVSKNPRSTIGTITGIYDFLRVLFAKVGTAHCPISHEIVTPQSREQILSSLSSKKGAKLYILTSWAKNKKASFKEDFKELLKKGFMRVRIDEEILDLSNLKELDPTISHDIDLVIDRVVVDDLTRLKEATFQALDIGGGFFSTLDIETKEEKTFSEFAYSPLSGLSYPPLVPQDFSFNHPSGMCEKCTGLGEIFEFDLAKIIEGEKSIEEDCCIIAPHFSTVLYGNIYRNLAKLYKFNLSTPWKNLSKAAQKVFLYGTDQKWTKMVFVHPTKNSSWQEFVQWRGVLYEAHKRLIDAKSEIYRKKMHELMVQMVCPDCHGNKLKAYPLACEFQNKKIYEITSLTLEEAYHFFQNLHLDKSSLLIAQDLIKEILKRLKFLLEVGLNYLTLDRNAPSLSGGEAQRVRLASHIGSGLIGTTYVLDEPSIGLHPQDHYKLINTLKNLRDEGNTVIVVEHDKDTIAAADTIVDFGPLAGKFGGEIVAQGTLEEIMNSKASLTGKYLKGELKIKVPKKRIPEKYLTVSKINHHNLKNVDLILPLNLFVCVTGASGSGKSSLISQTLYPAIYNEIHNSNLFSGKYGKIEGLENIDKIISVDQSPIGKTIRSNPATYIKVLDEIRDLFADLPESKVRGYNKGHFSFNVKEGSCPYCKGLGKVKVDMDFMEDEWTVCQQCKGMRFDPEILSVKFKDHSINDVLEMEVGTAIDLFEAIPHIASKLKLLKEVGLDYLHLGQSSTTLSGGESQRIKLAKELCKKATGKTLYILDEPTTGLHFHDIQKLLTLLQNLVDLGNSVVVIEHNMDFVKTSDFLIDIGPGAGEKGGKIIGYGPPEKIALKNSPTGLALKSAFEEKTLIGQKLEKIHHEKSSLIITNATTHNLKNLSLEIPLNKINIFTGPSGSGKTTLAFDTIFAEGQRRYLEALPLYTREFIKQLPKAEVEKVENMPPCIALEQKKHGANPRSTLGTITEIYDHLRILYSHMGTAYCPETKEEIKTISKTYVAQKALKEFKNEKLQILAPIKFFKFEDFTLLKERLNRQGFLRIRLNNEYYELDDEIPYNKSLKNELLLVVDRLMVTEDSKPRLLEAIESAAKIAGGEIILALPKKDYYFNLTFACESTGKSYPPITPQTFSFNSEAGMCLDCGGLGYTFGLNLSSDLFEYSISDFMQILFNSDIKIVKNYFRSLKIDLDEPLKNLSKEFQNLILMGDKKIYKENNLSFSWRGISTLLSILAKHSNHFIRESLIPLMQENTCVSCKGKRLNPLAKNVLIKGKSIIDFCSMDIKEAYNFSTKLSTDKKFLQETLSNINKNLKFLIDIGLGYLSLDRSAPSLSGGELERVYLAKHLGSGLTNCLYILDEPTIGLHPYNCDLLIKALKNLKDLNNTLIVVEHEETLIEEADNIFDFGPKAGREGGQIIAKGTLEEIKNDPNSITGLYLSGKKQISYPEKRRETKEFIEIKNASLHNLKNISIKIPKNVITSISGVSGSGKSTLINYVLKPAVLECIKQRTDNIDLGFAKISNLSSIENLIVINQHFLGNSLRSDVSTYSEIMPLVRQFFSELPLAKAKGMKPRYFSYNHRKGMCPTCFGFGYKKIDLQFLPSVQVNCPACNGYKLNSRSLEIKYKNKHIGQILDLTVEEALDFFSSFPKIIRKLSTLAATGLHYLKLGQPISTLSGGERQRLKLSKELSKRSTSKTLYLLDEPTIGLHSSDIEKLVIIFQQLAQKGASLIIIEHNMDILLNSDYVIDLGPYSGKEGGEIMCYGTPEEVAKDKKSYTARYLRKKLSSLK